MTIEILSSILTHHPEVIETGVLNLRSDNCSTQYKSRFVFAALLKLAEQHNIRINFFYGEACHGRGLIDAMAWCGCKGPMRKDILDHDHWYSNADKMKDFLSRHFAEDSTKEHHLVDPKITASIRKEGHEEHRIRGSASAHVISFMPYGTFMKWLTVKDFLDDTATSLSESDNDFEDEEEEEGDQPPCSTRGLRLELIQEKA